MRFEQDDPSDSLTVELDALELWKLGDRILRDRLAGIDEQTCRDVEWRRGMLPPGPLGARQLEYVLSEVRPLVDRSADLRSGPGERWMCWPNCRAAGSCGAASPVCTGTRWSPSGTAG